VAKLDNQFNRIADTCASKLVQLEALLCVGKSGKFQSCLVTVTAVAMLFASAIGGISLRSGSRRAASLSRIGRELLELMCLHDSNTSNPTQPASRPQRFAREAFPLQLTLIDKGEKRRQAYSPAGPPLPR
jgi:hypothetical protein